MSNMNISRGNVVPFSGSAHKDKSRQLQLLADKILERHKQPEDQYEVAALLESMGWNDDRAIKEFGVEDIFELASGIWDSIQNRIVYTPFSRTEKPSFLRSLYETIRTFLRGLIFAVPMAVSVASMLVLKFSLWSYQNLTVEIATSIALATILSFITVGGFTQAIARRGFFYIIQGFYNLARKSTFYFIRLGFLACIIISVLLLLFNFLFNLFSYEMILIIVIYFFFLNSIWLSVTGMYILKKELVFTSLIGLGIFLVYILFKIAGMDIILSQIISLLIVTILSFILVSYFFTKEEKQKEKGIEIKMPRISITLYSVTPYFLYGFLYFLFLFIDRVNAWSTNSDFMPYIIWFRGQYELGLDFALLALIIPMGISEVIVTNLMNDLEASQRGYLAKEIDKKYRFFVRKYYKLLVIILLSAIASSYLVYQLTLWYNKISLLMNDQNILTSDTTRFVLLWGIVSYVMLSVFLMNAVILFSISQPGLVIRTILPAVVLNVVLGFLLSRWFDYSFAVIGLLIGSLFMMVLSTYYVRRVLKNIDYYLYYAS